MSWKHNKTEEEYLMNMVYLSVSLFNLYQFIMFFFCFTFVHLEYIRDIDRLDLNK